MSIPNNIINYKSCFKFNDVSSNPFTFFLESLTFLDLNLMRKSFSYDMSSNNIECDYKNLSKLLLNLNKCLKGNLNIYGHSFSEKDLVLGNLYLYFIQFVSNYLFGHPEAYEPFKNDDIIKKAISNALENVSDDFYDNDKLNTFLKNNFFINGKLTFKHLDIIEFQINLPRFPIFFGLKQITIPHTTWIIKVLIRE
jgi:hypothetical protein